MLFIDNGNERISKKPQTASVQPLLNWYFGGVARVEKVLRKLYIIAESYLMTILSIWYIRRKWNSKREVKKSIFDGQRQTAASQLPYSDSDSCFGRIAGLPNSITTASLCLLRFLISNCSFYENNEQNASLPPFIFTGVVFVLGSHSNKDEDQPVVCNGIFSQPPRYFCP